MSLEGTINGFTVTQGILDGRGGGARTSSDKMNTGCKKAREESREQEGDCSSI